MSWFIPSDSVDRSYWTDGFVTGFLSAVMVAVLVVSIVLHLATEFFK